MIETMTCRECGNDFEFETGDISLDPKFLPQICRRCGREADALEEAKRVEENRIMRNVPSRYATATFASFKTRTPSQREALDAVSKHAGDGVYLSGSPGCGKTHLAAAAVMAGPEGSVFISTTDLLDDLRAGFDGDGQGLFERAKRAPLLALDDLGSESVTDWVRDRLYTLLNARWNSRAPMIVTTNCARSTIRDRIGAAGLSRLSMCRYRIEITGPDGRLQLEVAS